MGKDKRAFDRDFGERLRGLRFTLKGSPTPGEIAELGSGVRHTRLRRRA